MEASTRQTYTYEIYRHLLPAFGTRQMGQITKAMVRQWVADLVNATVWQVDRQSGEILGHVSHKGTNPGELFAPHVSAMDSKGNVYVGEIGRGSRVQKFVAAAN